MVSNFFGGGRITYGSARNVVTEAWKHFCADFGPDSGRLRAFQDYPHRKNERRCASSALSIAGDKACVEEAPESSVLIPAFL